jgi:serine/threonine-protein kinase
MAYVTNESGLFNVYVRPFPGPGGQWQISSGGGNNPRWSLTRHELIFHTQQTPPQLLAVPYSVSGDAFEAGRAASWSPKPFVAPPEAGFGALLDLHPDGERVAVNLPADGPAGAADDKAIVVFNFFDELRRLAPPRKDR